MKMTTEFSTVMLKKGADARAAKIAEGIAPEGLAEAVAAAINVPAERATRLIEALDLVGTDIDKVRLVRVFQGEKGPVGSTAVGEFHYSVDRVIVQGGRGRGGPRRDDRGGRGRDDRGGGRGGPGGPGGGGGGFGGFGDRRGPPKPRGLGSLKVSAEKKPEAEDDRPRGGEVPRAGIGWVLTAAPRDPRERGKGPGRGGPRRDGRGRGPGGPGGDRDGRGRGPGGGGPGGPRREWRGPGGPGGPGQPGDATAGPGPGGPGGPGGPEDGRGRRGGRGRGRGPGGPGGPGGPRGPGGGPRGPRGPGPDQAMNQPVGGDVQAATEAPATSATPADDAAKS